MLAPVASAQSLNWQLAVPKGIEINASTNAWHSGRVHDMVEFADGSVLVGTNGGGIWWASRTGESRPLSDTWDDPDVTAVERGSDSQFHIYVATGSGLYENQSPRLDAWQRINIPPGMSMVRDISILNGARRIYVSTFGRSVWFADIR